MCERGLSFLKKLYNLPQYGLLQENDLLQENACLLYLRGISAQAHKAYMAAISVYFRGLLTEHDTGGPVS